MESIEVAVVGAGQAGTATSHELSERGVEHVVLEAERPGFSWSRRWDSFTLVTPNHSIRLPGGSYVGDDPHGYLPRAGIEQHINTYAAGLAAEVRSGTRVDRLRPAEAGGFVLDTADGAIAARSVVVATGAHGRADLRCAPRAGSVSQGAASPALVECAVRAGRQLHTRRRASPDGTPHGTNDGTRALRPDRCPHATGNPSRHSSHLSAECAANAPRSRPSGSPLRSAHRQREPGPGEARLSSSVQSAPGVELHTRRRASPAAYRHGTNDGTRPLRPAGARMRRETRPVTRPTPQARAETQRCMRVREGSAHRVGAVGPLGLRILGELVLGGRLPTLLRLQLRLVALHELGGHLVTHAAKQHIGHDGRDDRREREQQDRVVADARRARRARSTPKKMSSRRML